MQGHKGFTDELMSNLEFTRREFLCNIQQHAIMLKYNAFRRVLTCLYATLRLPVPLYSQIAITGGQSGICCHVLSYELHGKLILLAIKIRFLYLVYRALLD